MQARVSECKITKQAITNYVYKNKQDQRQHLVIEIYFPLLGFQGDLLENFQIIFLTMFIKTSETVNQFN